APGGRLLGDREAARTLLVDSSVEGAQEMDRGDVLASAVLIRDPLVRLSAVIEVEHRSDRVDTDRVDVELLEPVDRVRDQERANLAAPVVEDQSTPVGVFSPAHVFVFVEGRA